MRRAWILVGLCCISALAVACSDGAAADPVAPGGGVAYDRTLADAEARAAAQRLAAANARAAQATANAQSTAQVETKATARANEAATASAQAEAKATQRALAAQTETALAHAQATMHAQAQATATAEELAFAVRVAQATASAQRLAYETETRRLEAEQAQREAELRIANVARDMERWEQFWAIAQLSCLSGMVLLTIALMSGWEKALAVYERTRIPTLIVGRGGTMLLSEPSGNGTYRTQLLEAPKRLHDERAGDISEPSDQQENVRRAPAQTLTREEARSRTMIMQLLKDAMRERDGASSDVPGVDELRGWQKAAWIATTDAMGELIEKRPGRKAHGETSRNHLTDGWTLAGLYEALERYEVLPLPFAEAGTNADDRTETE